MNFQNDLSTSISTIGIHIRIETVMVLHNLSLCISGQLRIAYQQLEKVVACKFLNTLEVLYLPSYYFFQQLSNVIKNIVVSYFDKNSDFDCFIRKYKFIY